MTTAPPEARPRVSIKHPVVGGPIGGNPPPMAGGSNPHLLGAGGCSAGNGATDRANHEP